MYCPQCKSSHNKKNGFRGGKQSYRCKDCGYQYVENPISRAYPIEVKQLCLKMYLNGMGFRAIARVTQIDHTTIINWVKEAGELLSDEPQDSEIPEITEIDELQTFVGNKKNKLWIWTVVNHKQKGILLWSIGDLRSIAEGIALQEPLSKFGKLLNAGIAFGMLRMVGRSIQCTSNQKTILSAKRI